jgi:hypothetical protein
MTRGTFTTGKTKFYYGVFSFSTGTYVSRYSLETSADFSSKTMNGMACHDDPGSIYVIYFGLIFKFGSTGSLDKSQALSTSMVLN